MYRIEPASRDVGQSLRDIAESQIDKALRDLERERDSKTLTHQLRKRCKKLRGLLRLVRPVFADFSREDAAVREAARMLSGVRDAEVLSQTVTKLMETNPRRSQTLEHIRDKILAEPISETEVRAQLANSQAALLKIRARIKDWSLTKKGFSAIEAGLERTIKSARQRMRTALKTRTAEDFHKWRKANKNHGYHVSLLRNTAPAILRPERDGIERLSELLGDHHDLDVLAETAARTPERFGTPKQVETLQAAVAGRRQDLETTIADLARQTLAERPRAVLRRYEQYWSTVVPASEEA